jgi:hypothetical protein
MGLRQPDGQIIAGGVVVKAGTAHHPGVRAEQVIRAHLRRLIGGHVPSLHHEDRSIGLHSHEALTCTSNVRI